MNLYGKTWKERGFQPKLKTMRLFEETRKPSMEAVRQYVGDVRTPNRIILTAEDMFAARELLPLLLDAYEEVLK